MVSTSNEGPSNVTLSKEQEDLLASAPRTRSTLITLFRQVLEGEEHSSAQPNVRNGQPPPPVRLPIALFVMTPGFEYAEHDWIGDTVCIQYVLPLTPGSDIPGERVQRRGKDLPIFTIGEGSDAFKMTYGTVSALAGDFYGTKNPISDGKTEEDCQIRFKEAYDTLRNNPQDQPGDAEGLVKCLREEVDAVNKAFKDGIDPSTVYRGHGVVAQSKLLSLTLFRKCPNLPNYLSLALIDWDHFGTDALIAWGTGHRMAINHAAGERSISRLTEAYFMNSFADHFLQDSFSSGHIRTPRRALHNDVGSRDRLAQYMHDEDCALGLTVTNGKGETWDAYGDRMLLDRANSDNLSRCMLAIEASAREVFEAWDKGEPFGKTFIPEPLRMVPRTVSEDGLAALFRGPDSSWDDLYRRVSIDNRTDHSFTKDWHLITTLPALEASKLWEYPMKLHN
ncbi:hypothetical protein PT974_09502 [Cladobotryum mycophilum]|uniref:Uncharacterized protein n=1 Tax=Cladobotryum mycophilum TaxID=491253 RepID=A0ABR0SGB2_9HYPO